MMKAIIIVLSVLLSANVFSNESRLSNLVLPIPAKMASEANSNDDKLFTLPVSIKNQKTQVWCWLASSAMVISYLSNRSYEDYEIGSKYFSTIYNQPINCTQNSNCVRPGLDFEILTAFNLYQLAAIQVFRPALNFEEVANHLSQFRMPIIAKMVPNGPQGIGHVVVIIGYDEYQNLIINDPYDGSSMAVNFNSFKNNYRNVMRWDGSFIAIMNNHY